MIMIEMLFYLLSGHALADFAFQGDAMAKGKNRHNKTTPAPGAKYQPCWMYWLSSHALIHGLAVSIATGIWWLGVAEAVAHWCIDFGKCENWYGIHTDQAAHIMCKGWWLLLAFTWV